MSDVDDIAIGLGKALASREAASEERLEKTAKKASWLYALIVAAVGALVWAFSAGVVYGNVATKSDLAAERAALTASVDRFNETAQGLSTRLTRIEVKLDGFTTTNMQPPMTVAAPIGRSH